MARERSVVVRVCMLIGVLALAGCYEPEPRPEIRGEDHRVVLPASQGPMAQHFLIGRSVQNRPIMIQVLGQGNDTTLVMAAIHGNEPAGLPLVNELLEHMRQNQQLLQGRRLVILPVANPDGLEAKTRENARGIDLNRNFEAGNRVDNPTNGQHALSEPESVALGKLIEDYKPARIVSIHQPLTCIDYDGPARALATRMAQYCDLPIKKLGARPGSLGAHTGEELKIPTITVELPEAASKLNGSQLWQQYGRMLLAAILYPEHPI